MSATILETEAFIRFRLNEMSSRNEHHRFEEVATRVAQKRVSANILIATGPVSSGGDQARDAESFSTHLPDELPHAAGFAAAASTAPVVVACTVQKDGLKQKVLTDLEGICGKDAAPVDHVAYFSVHPISEGITHDLQKTARETYGISLDIFCGADIATFLSEEDLIWVAQQYLELPTELVPLPKGEAAPEWYTELLAALRQNKGPASLTPAVQGGVAQGLRHATWDSAVNADLPEWLDFMGAFLADTKNGDDGPLAFRACYEMSVARIRGQGTARGVEDLIRRTISYAMQSPEPNAVTDAMTLVSYWGGMWSRGAAAAAASEIGQVLDGLIDHATTLLSDTDPETHPVRAAILIGALVFANLVPNWSALEQAHGKPKPATAAPDAGVKIDPGGVDFSDLASADIRDLDAALNHLDRLVDMLPHARAYSVSQIATVFNMFAPLASTHPSYAKVRDGLDGATASVVGDSAAAERSRDRAMGFVRAGQPLEALADLHQVKTKWFSGDTMYGSITTMRYIATLYSQLGLIYAAKMYACTAAALALMSNDDDTKEHAPKALLEAARYAQRAGTWIDAAALTEIALLARSQLLSDPFDFSKHPELESHNQTAILELAAIRSLWPDVEGLIKSAHYKTDWYDDLAEVVAELGPHGASEADVQAQANDTLAGPILSDLGPRRIIDFSALGVRWTIEFDNDRDTVLNSEGFAATLQVFLGDLALRAPVLIEAEVRIEVDFVAGANEDSIDIDDTDPSVRATVHLSGGGPNPEARTPSLIALCLQLVDAVHVRPQDELQALVEPMFREGLGNKVSIGRPYEEVAALLDDEHYRRCAAAARPESSARYLPSVSEHLVASSRPGTGYDGTEALARIRERYEVAHGILRLTLPRLLSDDGHRAKIAKLRAEGWLDWQILAMLADVVMNWRLKRDGISPLTVTPADVKRLLMEEETNSTDTVPLDWFDDEQLAMSLALVPPTVGQRWQLRTRPQRPEQDTLRGLMARRYRFDQDDVAHRDLLDCVDGAGMLMPFVSDEAGPPDEPDLA